jgi:hypothetical protein
MTFENDLIEIPEDLPEDKEIIESYFCQIWGNVKHMKRFIQEMRERYIRDNLSHQIKKVK